jgi:NTP pyrophosphatase (non-canonical NTP hydrolase)
LANNSSTFNPYMTSGEYAEWVSKRAVLNDAIARIEGMKVDELRHFCRQLLAIVGIAGEAGEIVDEWKKQFFHGRPTDPKRLCKEMGDLKWYFTLLASTLGLTDEQIQDANVVHLIERDGHNQEKWANRAKVSD